MILLVVFSVSNKKHDTKLQNVLRTIATVFFFFWMEKKHCSIKNCCFFFKTLEYIYKTKRTGVGYRKDHTASFVGFAYRRDNVEFTENETPLEIKSLCGYNLML